MPTLLAASLLSSASPGGAFCDDSASSPSSTSCALRKRAINHVDEQHSAKFVQPHINSHSARLSRCLEATPLRAVENPHIQALVDQYDLEQCARRPSVDLGAPVWVPEAWSFEQPKELKRKRDEADWVQEMLDNPTTKKSRVSSASFSLSSDFVMAPIAEESAPSQSSCTPSFLFPYVDYAQEEEHHPDPALESTSHEQLKDREALVMTYAQELEKLANAWSSFKGFLPNVKDLISILNEKDVLLNAIAEADPNNVKDCNMLFKLLFVQTQHIVFYREFLESLQEDSDLDDLDLDSVCPSVHMDVEVVSKVDTSASYSSADFSCSFENTSENTQKTSAIPSRFVAPQALAEHIPSVDCELGPMMTCDWTIVENYTY